MERQPPIIDLHAGLAKLTMFRGRTPQSTMENRKGKLDPRKRCPWRTGPTGWSRSVSCCGGSRSTIGRSTRASTPIRASRSICIPKGGREGAPADDALNSETELGYTLDPSAWGQGFASETARCVRDYARDVRGLSYTVSAILPSNARSRRVAERGGATLDGQMHVVGLPWDRGVWPLATRRSR